MKEIDYKIDLELEKILSRINLENLQIIFSDGVFITYGEKYIEVDNLYFHLNESEYIHIKSHWFECDYTAEDIHEFEISSMPELRKEEKSSIISFYNQNIVKNVSVFSKRIQLDDELIEYDYGIKIIRLDGKSILLTAGDLAFRKIKIYFCDMVLSEIINSENLIERLL